MILQLDIGNSRVKWRQRRAGETLGRGSLLRANIADLLTELEQTSRPAQVWVSSVAGQKAEDLLSQQLQNCWQLTPWFARPAALACGVTNSYAEPHRMGVDRWLAMLAARFTTGGPVCVVDAGSALTIDFVAADGKHVGGYILPGLDSMERALLSDTERVRFADAARDKLGPGRSTEEAVYNGLFLSQAGAVALALRQVEGEFRLFFSGGNGQKLCQCLGLGGTFTEDLVLDGLELLAAEQRGDNTGGGA